MSPVLILGPYRTIGGIAAVIRKHVEYLQEAGIPIRVVDTSAYHEGRGRTNFLRFIRAVRAVLSLHKAPVGVHAHLSAGRSFYRKTLLLGLLWRKFPDVPVILHLHHGRFGPWLSRAPHRWIAARLFRRASVLVTVSPLLAEDIGRLFPAFRPKLRALPNPLPYPPVEPFPRRAFSPPLRVLYLGFLKAVKDLPVLFEAIEEAARRHLPLRFILVGKGDAPLVREARNLARRHPKMVQYRPGVWGEEKAVLFRSAHVFLTPSRWESFSLVIYEAMAWGLPVVAVPHGGAAYLLSEEGALWAKPGDPQSFVEALERALEEGPDLAIRGRKNWERAWALYRYPVKERLLKLYREVFPDLKGGSVHASGGSGL